MRFAAEHADYNFILGSGVNTPLAFADSTATLVQAAREAGRDVGALSLDDVPTGMTEARQRDYERAGLDGHLAPGTSPALLLVDPARAYVDPDCPLYAGPGGRDRRSGHEGPLAGAREAGIPVVVTRVRFRPDGRDGGRTATSSTDWRPRTRG